MKIWDKWIKSIKFKKIVFFLNIQISQTNKCDKFCKLVKWNIQSTIFIVHV